MRGVLRGGERLGERASVQVGAKRQGFDNFSPMTSGDEKLPRNPFFAPSGSHLFPIYHPSSSLTTAPPSFTTLDTLTFVVPRLQTPKWRFIRWPPTNLFRAIKARSSSSSIYLVPFEFSFRGMKRKTAPRWRICGRKG